MDEDDVPAKVAEGSAVQAGEPVEEDVAESGDAEQREGDAEVPSPDEGPGYMLLAGLDGNDDGGLEAATGYGEGAGTGSGDALGVDDDGGGDGDGAWATGDQLAAGATNGDGLQEEDGQGDNVAEAGADEFGATLEELPEQDGANADDAPAQPEDLEPDLQQEEPDSEQAPAAADDGDGTGALLGTPDDADAAAAVPDADAQDQFEPTAEAALDDTDAGVGYGSSADQPQDDTVSVPAVDGAADAHDAGMAELPDESPEPAPVAEEAEFEDNFGPSAASDGDPAAAAAVTADGGDGGGDVYGSSDDVVADRPDPATDDGGDADAAAVGEDDGEGKALQREVAVPATEEEEPQPEPESESEPGVESAAEPQSGAPDDVYGGGGADELPAADGAAAGDEAGEGADEEEDAAAAVSAADAGDGDNGGQGEQPEEAATLVPEGDSGHDDGVGGDGDSGLYEEEAGREPVAAAADSSGAEPSAASPGPEGDGGDNDQEAGGEPELSSTLADADAAAEVAEPGGAGAGYADVSDADAGAGADLEAVEALQTKAEQEPQAEQKPLPQADALADTAAEAAASEERYIKDEDPAATAADGADAAAGEEEAGAWAEMEAEAAEADDAPLQPPPAGEEAAAEEAVEVEKEAGKEAASEEEVVAEEAATGEEAAVEEVEAKEELEVDTAAYGNTGAASTSYGADDAAPDAEPGSAAAVDGDAVAAADMAAEAAYDGVDGQAAATSPGDDAAVPSESGSYGGEAFEEEAGAQPGPQDEPAAAPEDKGDVEAKDDDEDYVPEDAGDAGDGEDGGAGSPAAADDGAAVAAEVELEAEAADGDGADGPQDARQRPASSPPTEPADEAADAAAEQPANGAADQDEAPATVAATADTADDPAESPEDVDTAATVPEPVEVQLEERDAPPSTANDETEHLLSRIASAAGFLRPGTEGSALVSGSLANTRPGTSTIAEVALEADAPDDRADAGAAIDAGADTTAATDADADADAADARATADAPAEELPEDVPPTAPEAAATPRDVPRAPRASRQPSMAQPQPPASAGGTPADEPPPPPPEEEIPDTGAPRRYSYVSPVVHEYERSESSTTMTDSTRPGTTNDETEHLLSRIASAAGFLRPGTEGSALISGSLANTRPGTSDQVRPFLTAQNSRASTALPAIPEAAAAAAETELSSRPGSTAAPPDPAPEEGPAPPSRPASSGSVAAAPLLPAVPSPVATPPAAPSPRPNSIDLPPVALSSHHSFASAASGRRRSLDDPLAAALVAAPHLPPIANLNGTITLSETGEIASPSRRSTVPSTPTHLPPLPAQRVPSVLGGAASAPNSPTPVRAPPHHLKHTRVQPKAPLDACGVQAASEHVRTVWSTANVCGIRSLPNALRPDFRERLYEELVSAAHREASAHSETSPRGRHADLSYGLVGGLMAAPLSVGQKQVARIHPLSGMFTQYEYLPSEYDRARLTGKFDRLKHKLAQTAPAEFVVRAPPAAHRGAPAFSEFTYTNDPADACTAAMAAHNDMARSRVVAGPFYPSGRINYTKVLRGRLDECMMGLCKQLSADWPRSFLQVFEDRNGAVVFSFDRNRAVAEGDISSYMNTLAKRHHLVASYQLLKDATQWGLVDAASQGVFFVMWPPWVRHRYLGPHAAATYGETVSRRPRSNTDDSSDEDEGGGGEEGLGGGSGEQSSSPEAGAGAVAQNLQAAFQKLFQTFAEKQKATRPKRWDMMEWNHVDERVGIEVFCNPNAHTTAFEAKLLITLWSQQDTAGLRVTTEARLSTVASDVENFLQG
ncbi:hypothetical protein GPECTOR_4g658 [Gonium pectorale]|uniref:Uncharacterized protein n=1 Tax=Gonium pectorale TaxID=33097 RepID=A0A150GXW0_GONPE|nr:hypothetical protein GPECTOR_4g658 [Gonium pectorale]|eukprot:KXZ54593.1 hypothetical protein GPECTOR_4g658 [Gonium pectorale]